MKEMRAFVDHEMCIGCGACAATAPDVFEMNEDGKAVAVVDTTDENRNTVMDAIDVCPVSAIREENNNDQKDNPHR